MLLDVVQMLSGKAARTRQPSLKKKEARNEGKNCEEQEGKSKKKQRKSDVNFVTPSSSTGVMELETSSTPLIPTYLKFIYDTGSSCNSVTARS